MTRSGYAALFFVVIAVCSGPGATQDVWAQAFGMISATVEKTDDARGLTVRSEPSASAAVVGFLPLGTEIKSCNDFKDGWVRMEIPSKGNWVNMAYLKPKGGDATVAAVDNPDLCLAIRKGPYSSYEKIGCAELGQNLKLSGVWSATNWARLEDRGWVDASKIDTDLMVCAAPLAARPAPEPQTPAEPQVEAPAPVVEVPVEVPAPPFGVAIAPPCYDGLGGSVCYGDFGAFGYFPGAFPFVSIGIGPYGRYYHHHGRPHPDYHRGGLRPEHYRGGPGHNSAYHRGTTRGWATTTGVNRRAASLDTMTRNFGTSVNRSAVNASRGFRSGRRGASVSRGVFSSPAFRSVGGRGFRGASFSRGRSLNLGSVARRSFRSSGFRGGSFHGGSFHGGGHHGGGSRGGGHRR